MTRRALSLLPALLLVAVGTTTWGEDEPGVGFQLRGRVTDTAGRGIAGVAVRHLVRTGHNRPVTDAEPAGGPAGRTDAAGWYRLPYDPRAEWITATAEGYATAAVNMRGLGTRFDLTLGRLHGQATGSVVDTRDAPVAGVTVHARRFEGGLHWWTTTLSELDGTFALPLPPGNPHLVTEAEGFWRKETSLPPLDAALEAHVRVILAVNPPISGVVVDAATGTHIEGASARVRGQPTTAADTDEDGRFELRRLQPYSGWTMRAAAEGYEPADADPVVGVAMRIALRPRTPLPPLPEAQAAPRPPAVLSAVEGEVVDGGGRPVPGAHVRLSPYRVRHAWSSPPSTIADANGCFRLDDVPSGRVGILAYRPDQVVFGEVWTVVGRSAVPAKVRIVVPEGHLLRGRVETRRRAPIEGVFVTATHAAAPGRSEAATDAEGRFVLSGLPEEIVQVHLQHVTFGPGPVPHHVFGAAGELPYLLRPDARPFVRARPMPDGHRVCFVGAVPPDGTRIAARPHYDDGSSASGYGVRVWGGQARLYASRAAEWTFEAPGFYGGPVTLPAFTEGDAPPIDIRLSAGATLEGVVHEPDGTPIGGATVKLAHPTVSATDPHRYGVHTNREGRFRFEGIKGDAPRTLEIRATGFLSRKLEVSADNDVHDIELGRAARVSGRVVPREGKVMPRGWRLAIRSGRGESVAYPHPVRRLDRRTGAFSFVGLEPGQYYLVVTADPKLQGGTVPFEIAEGAELEDLVVVAPPPAPTTPQGFAIAGAVIGRDGRPAAGARVRVTRQVDAESRHRSTQTDRQGRFRIEGLSEGLYDVAIEPHPPSPRLPRQRQPWHEAAERRGIAAGTHDLEIVAPRKSRIVGRVLPRTGRGMGACRVSVVPHGPHRRSLNPRGDAHVISPGGWFVLEGVEPGTRHLYVDEVDPRRGYPLGVGWTLEPVEVAAGETVRGVEIALRALAKVRVTVREPDGALASRAIVRAENPIWGRLQQIVERFPFSLGLTGAVPVRWEIRARRSDDTPWSESVVAEPAPGAEVDVEVVLPEP